MHHNNTYLKNILLGWRVNLCTIVVRRFFPPLCRVAVLRAAQWRQMILSFLSRWPSERTAERDGEAALPPAFPASFLPSLPLHAHSHVIIAASPSPSSSDGTATIASHKVFASAPPPQKKGGTNGLSLSPSLSLPYYHTRRAPFVSH